MKAKIPSPSKNAEITKFNQLTTEERDFFCRIIGLDTQEKNKIESTLIDPDNLFNFELSLHIQALYIHTLEKKSLHRHLTETLEPLRGQFLDRLSLLSAKKFTPLNKNTP